MLQKTVLPAVILAVSILTGGCLNQQENAAEEHEPPVTIQVLFEPRQEAGNEVPLLVRLTRGGEPVEQADEVTFEVWQHGNSPSAEVLEAEPVGDGMYEKMHIFENTGFFYVQSRAEVNGRTTATISEIEVGAITINQGEDSEAKDLPPEMFVSFGVQDELGAAEPAVLTVQINWEDEPWEDADVSFRIEGDEGHSGSVDAQEMEPGEYQAEYAFPEPGEYEVIIDMEKEDVSEELRDTVEVGQEGLETQ
ncbi:FixH family protein [Alteribacter natronophilus]|uniref:FixH family protein n=1 Tax=Alteribacter natronophilus TaxID=2583810 RepID=UPI001486102E|nr:FixH family protein [Alteribacter natronophilus]